MSAQSLSQEWWSSLHHEGLLIAPGKLAEYFGVELEPLDRSTVDHLRRDLTRVLDDESHLGAFLDTVLEQLLGLDRQRWRKASQVGSNWSHASITGGAIRPRRLWEGPRDEVLPVFTIEREKSSLRVGRGRRETSRVIEWLRKADRPLAILTNGAQLRLIHAGPDYVAQCEWDLRMWFEEGQPGPQVTALRQLLRREAIKRPKDDEQAPLLRAIVESRRAQGELSAVLGERVRQAVEKLIQESSKSLEPLLTGPKPVAPKSIYIAAARLVMRMVVVLFGEARDMLPRENSLYHGSYGLQGLREQLERAAGGHAERLGSRYGAWPRILGLFRLIHEGSHHEDLPVQRYGGGLFRPGERDSDDPVSRALARFEHHRNELSDKVVYEMLRLLTRSKFKVRQGRGSIWVDGPVNFAELDTEYIGILYEGLLDYELRRAPGNDPIVFLNIGDQPALPFSRLDEMTVKARKQLFEKFGKQAKTGGDEEAEEETDEGEDEDAEQAADESAEAEAEPDEESGDQLADTDRWHRVRVHEWARNAVRDAGWTKKGADFEDPEVIAAAKRLVARLVLPEQWYLVRWGGTRKGSGTFYTPPQLARPTTRRTLQPLAYEAVNPRKDPETGLIEVDEWVAKTPEEILKLKVCDPAMGSGSFLVAALDYLTDALFKSLHVHGRLEPKSDHTIVRLADGQASNDLRDRSLPVPKDHEEFEPRLRAQLKRHVVERCIYGVDLDPLAVELARLSLWVHTMDPRLPFEFLDHKLRCGNSLVGCWFDRFEDYPILAWEREGGDKGHGNFVHHFREVVGKGKKKAERKGDAWTEAIKQRKAEIKEHLVALIQARKQPGFSFRDDRATANDVVTDARERFEAIHHCDEEPERQEQLYRDLRASVAPLRDAFDTWCALWFWPGDVLEHAPTPQTLSVPSQESLQTIERLREEHRFFHWELEFFDVFNASGAGFDAILGNPPWDIQKPNSKEFFSNVEPLYRGFGKQEALRWQTEAFEADAELERDWIAYQARFKSLSNWVRSVGEPFGDPARDPAGKAYSLARSDNLGLHRVWSEMRGDRRGFADPEHPFRHQGSADLNSYKLFVESAHALTRAGGRVGVVIPSGLYTDKGTAELRELLLERCRWEWLFGFENRDKVFDIDGRFKFAAVLVEKGARTESLRTAFMRRDLADWNARPQALAYPRARVAQFSPKSKAILEVGADRDLEVLQKLYDNGVLLGDTGPDGWGIEYAREFDMTNDSKLFAPRPKWENQGYRADEYGHWLKGGWRPYSGAQSLLKRKRGLVLSRDRQYAIAVPDIEDVALPLYEGRMIGQFDFSEKGWVSGKGRSAVWRDISLDNKVLEPQFLIPRDTESAISWPKVGFMAIGSATNRRSLIASFIDALPAGNSLGTLHTGTNAVGDGLLRALALTGVLNSFTFDAMLRYRLGGLNINLFVLAENTLPRRMSPHLINVALRAASLSMISERFARQALQIPQQSGAALHWRRGWASSAFERARAWSMLDALVAHWYGLDAGNLGWILRDCDWAQTPANTDPKGFWRVDKDKPPELRHTVLSLIAFHDLQRMGLQAFLDQNDGEGWMLPKTLRLADYGLGHDDRAKQHQPVAEVLGPRFFDWQLTQSVQESWEECERHAELLEQILPLPKPDAAAPPEPEQADSQLNMFGATDPQPAKKKRASKKKKSS